MTANFEIIHTDVDNKILTIRDLGPWDRYQTVTNAAEEIVDALFRVGWLKDGWRLLYYDSKNDLDEILITDKTFAGFRIHWSMRNDRSILLRSLSAQKFRIQPE